MIRRSVRGRIGPRRRDLWRSTVRGRRAGTVRRPRTGRRRRIRCVSPDVGASTPGRGRTACGSATCGLIACDLTICDLTACDLTACDLTACDLTACDLTACDLTACDLTACDLTACDLTTCGRAARGLTAGDLTGIGPAGSCATAAGAATGREVVAASGAPGPAGDIAAGGVAFVAAGGEGVGPGIGRGGAVFGLVEGCRLGGTGVRSRRQRRLPARIAALTVTVVGLIVHTHALVETVGAFGTRCRDLRASADRAVVAGGRTGLPGILVAARPPSARRPDRAEVVTFPGLGAGAFASRPAAVAVAGAGGLLPELVGAQFDGAAGPGTVAALFEVALVVPHLAGADLHGALAAPPEVVALLVPFVAGVPADIPRVAAAVTGVQRIPRVPPVGLRLAETVPPVGLRLAETVPPVGLRLAETVPRVAHVAAAVRLRLADTIPRTTALVPRVAHVGARVTHVPARIADVSARVKGAITGVADVGARIAHVPARIADVSARIMRVTPIGAGCGPAVAVVPAPVAVVPAPVPFAPADLTAGGLVTTGRSVVPAPVAVAGALVAAGRCVVPIAGGRTITVVVTARVGRTLIAVVPAASLAAGATP
jgi:hypothetical protein